MATATKHITEHETENGTPAWIRAAMRQKLGLRGAEHFDARQMMTREEYASAVRAIRDHQPGKPDVPATMAPSLTPSQGDE